MTFYIKISDHDALTYYKKNKIKTVPVNVRLGDPTEVDADKKPQVEGDESFVPVYYSYSDRRVTEDDIANIQKDVPVEVKEEPEEV